jgi:UDP-N-acetylenolpyruvoylglucosamine reductase
VAAEAKRHELAGFEFLEGIPGSIGGALRMNAGAMGGAIFDLVEAVRLMDFQGRSRERTRGEFIVEYRACPLLKTHIALAAVLQGRPGAPAAIEQRMSVFSRKRWSSQPAAPSAGCIFRNPPAISAGKLIDELGLKGARVGGAVVSPEHGNFIVNDGGARARDVLELIALIQQRAKVERGIDLQTEVEIIGDEP